VLLFLNARKKKEKKIENYFTEEIILTSLQNKRFFSLSFSMSLRSFIYREKKQHSNTKRESEKRHMFDIRTVFPTYE